LSALVDLVMPEGTGGQGQPPEDEIDRKFRELTENRMGEARYIEPTAAERERRAAQYRKQTQREQRRQRRRAQRGRLVAGVIASFAPGSAEFIGNVIKVHGTMSAGTAREAGGVVLAVTVDYLFAYAVEPPGRPADWMRVVDHQYGSVDFAPWDDPGGPLEPADQTIIGNAGITCGTTDGYIHPAYPSQRSSGAAQSGPAVNPYSSATSVPGGGAVCGRTSGT
jgi:hypothetical protein